MPNTESSRVSVVVITRDRVTELCRTLANLRLLEPRPSVVVVDNASRDGTAEVVRANYPEVTLVRNERNTGCAARNLGVGHTSTPYVAFCDDDSWWTGDSLEAAADAFDTHPRLGLVAAAVLVGGGERADPVNDQLLDSPLKPDEDLPGPRVLGFLACACVVRRVAFEDTGGFEPLLFFGGEEALLAQDLAARGWGLCHLPRIHAHHHPSEARPPSAWRRTLEERNALLTSWLRRGPRTALAHTARALGRALWDPCSRKALWGAVVLTPEAWTARRRVPASVEHDLELLERA
ncbi:glycosyltransferase family 2 protein [Nocardiopsis xinjiangensis]|uniref:glycosyltransferase family 2 protein n=1 Tax=Nocardiopsis xinjiangensis TaxID=124285 RepID=UPI00034C5F69|nr:glycosyltransferase [Nocardiopsis xinjiangensis]